MKPSTFWLLVIVLVAVLLVGLVKGARTQDERQVRRDCRADALRFCTADVARYLANPNDAHRAPIIACMLANRDKLQTKCSRHLY